MKYKEIKSLSSEERRSKLVIEEGNLRKLRFAHAISPIENPMRIKYSRRLMAQLKTAENAPKKLENSHIEMLRNQRKERVGQVVSNKGDKTVVVLIKRMVRHPFYGKFINKSARFMAHDEKNECSMGDVVKIMEVRPLSKRKRWRLVQIIEKAK